MDLVIEDLIIEPAGPSYALIEPCRFAIAPASPHSSQPRLLPMAAKASIETLPDSSGDESSETPTIV
jgi:hypothetical protein